MARALWTGSLGFGLVSVPVSLFAATEDRSIRFHQFEQGTSDRVRSKRVNERTGDEVAYDRIVKGYDLGGGEVVLLSPQEIAAAAPGASRSIDVSAFVELSEIDPLYFDTAYYVAPGKGGERVYALLLQTMHRANRVAIATVVLRDIQHLVAVRPRSDVLVLETLHYPDEVRDPRTEIGVLPVEAELNDRELDMALMLIDTMTAPWRPEDYHDTHREELNQIIDQKRAGAVVTAEKPRASAAPVVDLLQALEASVRASRREPGGAGLRPSSSHPASRARRDAGRWRGATSTSTMPASPAKPAGPGTAGSQTVRRGPAGPGPAGLGPAGLGPAGLGPAGLGPAGPGTVGPGTVGPGTAGTAGRGTGRRSSSAPDELSSLSKAELLRRAADLDIAGRSRMDRDALEAALRQGLAGRRRRAS